jgi:carboxylesterase type B
MTDNLYLRAWDWTDTDRHLAAAMADAWVRFVTHVDPNGPGLPTWRRIDGTEDAPVLVFADEPRAGTVERADALRLLDALPRPL